MGKQLQKYYNFLKNGERFLSEASYAGGFEKLRGLLHVNATLELMSDEKIEDYDNAKKRVGEIIEEWSVCDEENHLLDDRGRRR